MSSAVLCAIFAALTALGGCASDRQQAQPVQPYAQPAAQPAYSNTTAPAYGGSTAAQPAACYNCGTVTNIEPIAQGSSSNVAGAVIGAVVGAAVGHQFGGGRGNTAATVAGAAGGAYAGSKIQGKYANGDQYDYRITLQMQDGNTCTLVQDQPPNYGVGARVRLNSSSQCGQ